MTERQNIARCSAHSLYREYVIICVLFPFQNGKLNRLVAQHLFWATFWLNVMCFAMISVKSIRVLEQLWPSTTGHSVALASLRISWKPGSLKGQPRYHKLGRRGLVENWLGMAHNLRNMGCCLQTHRCPRIHCPIVASLTQSSPLNSRWEGLVGAINSCPLKVGC